MNRIVRDNYPVAALPEDLRQELSGSEYVRLVIEADPTITRVASVFDEPEAEAILSLKDLFALRRPPYKSTEEIVEEVRRQRDEWDD